MGLFGLPPHPATALVLAATTCGEGIPRHTKITVARRAHAWRGGVWRGTSIPYICCLYANACMATCFIIQDESDGTDLVLYGAQYY
jgi:hypothetical protein